MNIEDWLPLSPLQGPPLPRFLNVLWPWIKGGIPGEEVPPEEGGMEPFTFGTPSASLVTYESATAWKTVVFSCSINNPNSEIASETVKFIMEDRRYYYSDNGDPYVHSQPQVSTKQIAEQTISLGPGETKVFEWNGNEGDKGPLLPRPHDFCFSLQGKANESTQACVSNQ